MYEFVADQVVGINGLINLSNIVFLVAFSVRDVLKLRILSIVGEGMALPYYHFQDEKLWPPIVWGAAFMLVNAVRVVAIALERRPVVLSHPTCGEWNQREPEQQMQVGPEDLAVDPVGQLEHVVVIVPVDPQVDEAQDIAGKNGNHRPEGRQVGSVGHFQFQHHDGDENRDDPIAEGFEPSRGHIIPGVGAET